jgi:hypothetical protein
MGIFDTLFRSTPSTITYAPQSEQEAWIAIMYACMAADGEISDTEIDKLCELLVVKTLFRNKEIADYYQPAMLAHKHVGSKILIDSSVSLIQENNKATLFTLTMELLLADGILGEKEKEIAEYLTAALALDPETSRKIVEIMLIRNNGNFVIVN